MQLLGHGSPAAPRQCDAAVLQEAGELELRQDMGHIDEPRLGCSLCQELLPLLSGRLVAQRSSYRQGGGKQDTESECGRGEEGLPSDRWVAAGGGGRGREEIRARRIHQRHPGTPHPALLRVWCTPPRSAMARPAAPPPARPSVHVLSSATHCSLLAPLPSSLLLSLPAD